jgi:hypothetical protein
MLDLSSEGLSFFVGNFGIVFAQAFQDKVRDIFNIMLPFLFATYIIKPLRV